MKTKVIKGLIIGLIVAGIGVTAVCLIRAKHTAEAKQEEILLCKEETKWYYRTENGVLQRRQWSLTYGRWMSEWTDVAGTEIPGNEIIDRPSDETDKIPEKKEGLLAKSDNEIRNAAYASLGLNPAEWFGKYLKKTSEEAVLLLYPPKAQITQTDCYADIVLSTKNYICLVSVRQEGEELSFVAVKEYGVSQVGIYEMGKDTYFGIVYSDTSDFYGIEAYGMTWYRLDGAGNCQRVCTVAETSGLYDYWKDKKPVISTDGTITLYSGNGEATTVSATVFLSGTVPYNAEYGVSGPELIRKVIQEDEKREDLYFRVEYEGAEVTHYITNEDRVYFIIQKYSSSHAAGFRSIAIGTMDLDGNILYCDVFSADRSEAIYLQTVEENYGQYGADYLVLSTETEYQGQVSSEKQVFRTDETGFVRTWMTKENGQEYVIDYDAERIPIDETCFSGELFREYIKREIDTNGDGLLTKNEREQVRSINFDSGRYRSIMKGQYTEKKAALDGLNWFPNLERLELMSEAEVYLYQHPSITVVNWNESGSSLVFAEDCDKLDTIAVHMSSGGAVYANNCEQLHRIYSWDGNLGAVYTFDTPKLEVCVDWFEEFPKYMRLDAEGSIIYRMWSDTDEPLRLEQIGANVQLSEDRTPEWRKIYSEDIYTIEWLGLDTEALHVKEQMEEMYHMYKESALAELSEELLAQAEIKSIVYSPQGTSIYMIGVWDGMRYRETLLAGRYYIAEQNGTIKEFDSVEEVFLATEGYEDLIGIKNLFQLSKGS